MVARSGIWCGGEFVPDKNRVRTCEEGKRPPLHRGPRSSCRKTNARAWDRDHHYSPHKVEGGTGTMLKRGDSLNGCQLKGLYYGAHLSITSRLQCLDDEGFISSLIIESLNYQLIH